MKGYFLSKQIANEDLYLLVLHMCLRLKGDCVCVFHQLLQFVFWFHLSVFKAPSCTFSLLWNVSFSPPHSIQVSIQINIFLTITCVDTDEKTLTFALLSLVCALLSYFNKSPDVLSTVNWFMHHLWLFSLETKGWCLSPVTDLLRRMCHVGVSSQSWSAGRFSDLICLMAGTVYCVIKGSHSN